MDIHRSRFVPFPASPINAVAFSRSDDKDLVDPKPALKLAVGRLDGSIEIWNPDRGNWLQEAVFPGGEGRSIDGLAWTQDPNETDPNGKTIVGQQRLFSIGSVAGVTEWNLETGLPLRTSTGNFNEVWCIAAQPRQKLGYTPKEGEWTGQDLIVGCGDGTLVLLSTAEDDLTFKKFLARSGSRKTRCMSVIWQNRDRVVAGFSDSTIRVYDVRSGSVLRNMSLGTGLQGARKNVLVWRIKCLPNGDMVSTDSNGEVVFWDGKTYSMNQRISGHESDCVDLITSSDGQTILSGGIDGKVAAYKLTEKDGKKRKWAKLSHRRIHQGDLKSMAVYDTKQMSVVATGGADTMLSIAPLRQLNKEYHRRLPNLPQEQPLASASSARLLVSWWDRSVYIWQIGEQESVALQPSAQSRKLVGGVSIKGEDNISSVSISRDGRLLCVATTAATKLFQLRPTRDAQDVRLRCRPVNLSAERSRQGARLAQISPNGQWLVLITPGNEIQVHRIHSSAENPKHLEVLPDVAELERVHRKPTAFDGMRRYQRTITRLVFSPDSSTFCITDLAGHIETFTLTGTFSETAPLSERVKPIKARGRKASAKKRPIDSDSEEDTSSSEDEEDLPLSFSGQIWTLHPAAEKLPKLDSQALVMTFHPEPGLESALVVVTQHHQIYEFDLTKGKLSDWSRRNPTGTFPAELRSIKDRVMGAVWDWNAVQPGLEGDSASARRQARIWLYGSSWLGMLDVSREFGDNGSAALSGESEQDGKELVASGKRKRLTEEERWQARVGDRKKRKGKSGAGDAVPDDEKGGMSSRSAQQGDEMAPTDNEDDLMDIDEELGPLRKMDGSEVEDSSDKESNKERRRRWWCTFKYRPILGIVPLARGAGGTGDGVGAASVDAMSENLAQKSSPDPLEVVLVERPVWDLEHMRD
ncbi:hypothetical protein CAC42_6754 [Sphaceloma murrayae]|uniref:Uncharacterized protein n=1 Tax=Sphaceloma murrayae TaxID=2082308 RepID=A0A2K1QH47_9PEZI|nr:hypothetical protein CAC42_6754 [Sphaceloma murrayae]